MVFDVVTLFPGMFVGPLSQSIPRRGRRCGAFGVRVHDLRRWGVGSHRSVDAPPYGGGGGMVLRPEPFFAAVEWIRGRFPAEEETVVLLSPQGRRLDHAAAAELARRSRVILLCGRYEGVDERVGAHLADRELSVGDFVLSGGELAALMTIDAVSRFVPGVLGRAEAADEDSFARGQLDPPYYTRPDSFRGWKVPGVLLSGDHDAIARWRAEQALEATRAKRPDLLEASGPASAGPAREG